MIDLLGNAINHIPGHIIRDRTRIGNDNEGRQYVLVLEDGEFRVYMYEFLDEILEEVYNTENFRETCDYFYDFEGYLNINTLSYTRLDIDCVDLAIAELYTYVSTYLDEEETPIDLMTRISTFIKKNLVRLGTKVYQYYK